MGRRRRKWPHRDRFGVAADRVGCEPRNAMHERLNRLLGEIGFDLQLENAAEAQ